MRWRRRLAGILAGAAALSFAAGARADSFPRVAVHPDGRAFFSFRHEVDRTAHVRERARSVSGTYTASRGISFGTGGWAYGGEIGVDAAGAATYAWDRGTSPDYVYGRRRAADGTLEPLQTLSPPHSGDVAVAVDRRGSAVFAWHHVVDYDPDHPVAVIQERRRSADGKLGPIRTLSPADGLYLEPEVAVDADGNALVVWVRSDPDLENAVVQARRIGADGAVGALRTLSAPAPAAAGPQVAFDAKGNALVAWTSVRDRHDVPELTRRTPTGAYSPVQTLSTSPLGADHLRLGVAPDGSATIVWTTFANETGNVVRACRRAADGTLGAVVRLSPDRSIYPDVAVDPGGGATVVWTHTQSDANGLVQTRRRPAAGPFGSTQTVSAPEQGDVWDEPQVAVDGDGNAMFAWVQYPPWGDYTILARRRTAAGLLGAIESVSG